MYAAFTATLRSYNVNFYDGSTLLYTAVTVYGNTAAYAGATPTKASTAQYSYTFAGWSMTNGGSADSNALKNVTADRNVYAAFTATVRTYTVTWKNGTTTLETDTNVPYGTTPTYNGSTPEYTGSGDAADYKFNGWSPAVGAITGDTTYTAQFKYSAYYYVKLIDRSISGAYINETVESIGRYAFKGCTALTEVDFPAATSIGRYAFEGCTALTKADFRAVTSIDDQAFYWCSKLTTLILRSETMATLISTKTFTDTAIKKGTGYIYVPSALVDSYKAATNWSTFANQIRAIEDYPDITGGAA